MHSDRNYFFTYGEATIFLGHPYVLTDYVRYGYRLGRTLNFDPVKLEFVGDDAANRLIDQPMREPWKI